MNDIPKVSGTIAITMAWTMFYAVFLISVQLAITHDLPVQKLDVRGENSLILRLLLNTFVGFENLAVFVFWSSLAALVTGALTYAYTAMILFLCKLIHGFIVYLSEKVKI